MRMNWEYISGFLDADGSVTLCKKSKNRERSPQISFHNNELDILIDIKDFIKKDLNISGFISKKRKSKKHHNQAFDLKYEGFPKCLAIISKLKIIHKNKNKRINIITKLKEVTPRNGKYNEYQMEERRKLEFQFFN